QQVAVARGGTRGDAVFTTHDARVLVSQSAQVDILNAISPPLVLATNPANGTTVALPLAAVTVTFDQDMYVGAATHPGSVTNPANYALTGADGQSVAVTGIDYNAASHTAILHVQGLVPEGYTLTVERAIKGASGYPLTGTYRVSWSAVSDFTAYADIQF